MKLEIESLVLLASSSRSVVVAALPCNPIAVSQYSLTLAEAALLPLPSPSSSKLHAHRHTVFVANLHYISVQKPNFHSYEVQ